MPKKRTLHRRTIKRRTIKRKKYIKRNTRKHIGKSKKGGNGKVNCCMCGEEKNIDETLVPAKCLVVNGKKAHRICQDCWWGDHGFASETASHACPGCVKKLPLTNPLPKGNEETGVVDLTLEDD